MKILMVSPFPPLRDGIGKYASQEVVRLREQGHTVEVLSPVPCAAHHVEDLHGGLKLLKLRRYARSFDRVILQYQPSHYHTHGSGPRRILSNLGMLLAFATVRNLTVVCHEIEYPPPSWPGWRPETVLERAALRRVPEMAFHTQREVDELQTRLGVTPRKVTLRDHGAYFMAATSEDQTTARRRLDVPADATLFLCIGFIQPHKGFDRAIRAFRRVHAPAARLVVIGSVRTENDEHRNHVRMLERLAAADARVTVRETMLSDEEFDRWIVASDRVVLPYREIWSSGVYERAKLFGRPVIAADVGGLSEQGRPGDVIVADDEALAKAMAEAATGSVGAPVESAAQHLTVEEAERLVRRAGALSQTGTVEETRSTEITAAIDRLDRSRGVHPVILPSPRPGVGPALTVAKRFLRRGMGWYIVPMLGQINEFEDRTLDAIQALVNEIEGLHRHVDVATGEIREAIERSRSELRADLTDLDDRLGGLVDDAQKRVGQVERRTRQLVAEVESGSFAPSGAERPPAGDAEHVSTPASSEARDYTTFDYYGFENHFRGDPVEIKRKQREAYLELFTDQAPVVDVGCGRGEFLEVLREAGIEARGVDLDLDMVAECRERGLDVTHGDGIEYVRGLEAGSVGGVIALQVVEHLPPPAIVGLLAAAHRALRPGGLLVLETINPKSLFALANWYTMDLTHAQPVHPNTLAFLARQEGFPEVDVRYYTPVRQLDPDIDLGPDAPPWARVLAEAIRTELKSLNEVVFGPQDYALVARSG